jgi:hypothetical protein
MPKCKRKKEEEEIDLTLEISFYSMAIFIYVRNQFFFLAFFNRRRRLLMGFRTCVVIRNMKKENDQ